MATDDNAVQAPAGRRAAGHGKGRHVLGPRSLIVAGLALLAAVPAAAHPAEQASVDVGKPQLVSRNSAGEVSSYPAHGGSFDRTGRYVVFESLAPNLHRPGVDYAGVYLRDRRTGRTTMPVRNRHGKPNRVGSSNGSLSPNGRFLAFCSFDPNIVRPDSFVYDPGDHPYPEDTDVFVRDLRAGGTRRLSTAWNGKEADDYSCGARVADNGDTFFTSFASNLVRRDPDGGAEDSFLYDWSSRRLYRLGKLDAATISGDGRLVAGLARKRLVDADRNSYDDLYVLHRRRDGSPGRYELISDKPSGQGLEVGCRRPVATSYDGRYVVGGCTDGDVDDPPIADKGTHLALFDRKRGTRTLLNPSTEEVSEVSTAAVSDDGRSVVFGSHYAGYVGVPYEIGPDVFYWRKGRGLTLVSVGNDSVYRWWGSFVDMTGDGSQLLFESDSPLVPDATPGVLDSNVYVVRLGD